MQSILLYLSIAHEFISTLDTVSDHTCTSKAKLMPEVVSFNLYRANASPRLLMQCTSWKRCHV